MSSITQRIKESLGINPDTKIGRELSDDTFDNTPGPSSEVDLHAAGPTTQPGAHAEEEDHDEILTEEQRMERDINAAGEKLQTLELGPGSWSLIDRALDSLSRNTGAGLEDPEARDDARRFAALVKATDNDLSVLISAIVESSAPTEAAGSLYSALYRVLKNCVFFANLDYRQAQGMDSFSDEATVQAFFDRYVSSTYVEEALARVVGDIVLSDEDLREKEQADQVRSDQGYEARREIELQYLTDRYGATDVEDAVVQALQDVQLLFQLNVEVLGWPPERPMPFGNVQNPDGTTFTPINDALQAIDAAEIARQASQKKRREKRASMLADAAVRAAALVAAANKRPTVHRK